jgi:hypothetical protein
VKRPVPVPLLFQEIPYPMLFLRGTSGVGGEEICAAATPLPRNHLPAAVPAWKLWCRQWRNLCRCHSSATKSFTRCYSCMEPLVWVVKRSVPLPFLYQEITYPLLFLCGTSGVAVKRSVLLLLLCHEITYPLLFLHGISGVGGEEISAAAAPLPRNHLPTAVPSWNLWSRQ